MERGPVPSSCSATRFSVPWSVYTLLVHLDGPSRADALRDGLIEQLADLPVEFRGLLSWDQGSEIAHHHTIANATDMPVFLCHAGQPWERPSNEDTNGLLRDYFRKGTDLRRHDRDRLCEVADELNRRPRKTLGWRTLQQPFDAVRATIV